MINEVSMTLYGRWLRTRAWSDRSFRACRVLVCSKSTRSSDKSVTHRALSQHNKHND